MTTARRNLISAEVTPYYHCISRCVRRAWLCGRDAASGRDYGHRKAWLENRIVHVASIFAVDVAAYAVMSNHYHVVVAVDFSRADEWSIQEVILRWGRLCRLPAQAKAFLDSGPDAQADLKLLHELAEKWRDRLRSVSWFMRFINEPIARLANTEDDCTGRFWEGRFKSQALLDEAALVSCMVYVDLNPQRAGVTSADAAGAFTSLARRRANKRHGLAPFGRPSPRHSETPGLPIDFRSYGELVRYTGKALRSPSSARPTPRISAILDSLEATESWFRCALHRPRGGVFFGAKEALQDVRKKLGKAWLWDGNRPGSASSRWSASRA